MKSDRLEIFQLRKCRGVLAKIWNKLMIQFQENIWTDGRADGQTIFHMNLPVNVGVPKLFVKDSIFDKFAANRPGLCFVFVDKC